MKHFSLFQVVTRPRYRALNSVRFMRATNPDQALAVLIRMHVPAVWR